MQKRPEAPYETRGHIFGIGREFHGVHARVMRVTATNVPRPTMLDARRAWDKARGEVSKGLVPEDKWKDIFQNCVRTANYTPAELSWKTISHAPAGKLWGSVRICTDLPAAQSEGSFSGRGRTMRS